MSARPIIKPVRWHHGAFQTYGWQPAYEWRNVSDKSTGACFTGKLNFDEPAGREGVERREGKPRAVD